VLQFLDSGGEQIIDPDGPGPTWEVPIADPDELETLNFSTEKYSEPKDAPSGQPEGDEPLLALGDAPRCLPATDTGTGTGTGTVAPPGGGAAGRDDNRPTLPATGGGGLAVAVAMLALGGALGSRWFARNH
jgi:hypothetical protein